MLKSNFVTIFSLVVGMFVHVQRAHSESNETIFTRIGVGKSFSNKLNDYSQEPGLPLSLDLGLRFDSGLILGGSFGYWDSNDFVVSTGVNGSDGFGSVSMTSFVVSAGYSRRIKSARLSVALGIGVLRTDTTFEPYSYTFNNQQINPPEVNDASSRLALKPQVDFEVDVYQGILVGVGIEHVTGFGKSPRPNVTTALIKAGYSF